MSSFLVHYRDECGSEGSMDVHECSTHDAVYIYMEDQHPELTVQAVYSPEEQLKRSQSYYEQAERDYDYDYYYG